MERVSAYAEGVRHERAMSESAAHGESNGTQKSPTAGRLMEGASVTTQRVTTKLPATLLSAQSGTDVPRAQLSSAPRFV